MVYDLENSPLQIRTDSVVGSNEMVNVRFYKTSSNSAGGGVLLYFSPPQYYLRYCTTSWTNFPTELPSKTDKVWTISLSRTSGEIRVKITCNEKEILNVVLCNTCTWWKYSNYWNRDVDKIEFLSSDTASDYYRPGKILTFSGQRSTSGKNLYNNRILNCQNFAFLPC